MKFRESCLLEGLNMKKMLDLEKYLCNRKYENVKGDLDMKIVYVYCIK